jgi:hypothetical protein
LRLQRQDWLRRLSAHAGSPVAQCGRLPSSCPPGGSSCRRRRPTELVAWQLPRAGARRQGPCLQACPGHFFGWFGLCRQACCSFVGGSVRCGAACSRARAGGRRLPGPQPVAAAATPWVRRTSQCRPPHYLCLLQTCSARVLCCCCCVLVRGVRRRAPDCRAFCSAWLRTVAQRAVQHAPSRLVAARVLPQRCGQEGGSFGGMRCPRVLLSLHPGRL